MAMMLGILGTFWGLAIMVQEISLEMPNSAKLDITSWKQAIDNIGAVLAGMKTAFSTSLVGMFCAVISSSINFGIQKIQANFLQKMEKFTTEDLLPATVPVVEDETLLEQVNQQLSESFNSLNDIFDKNNNTIEELNAVEQAFGDIIKEIRGITRTEASRDLDQIIEKLSDANGTIVALVGHLPQVVSAIENTNNRIDNIARIQKNSLLLNASPKAVLLFVGGVVIVFNLIILIAFLV
jgi:biopolymer transport protein ExbB/TolQ